MGGEREGGGGGESRVTSSGELFLSFKMNFGFLFKTLYIYVCVDVFEQFKGTEKKI